MAVSTRWACGGLASGLGQITALIGTYLALAQIVLMARVPWIDHVVGSNRRMGRPL